MEIIKKVEDGVEFYTVLLTGESGMSQSGLAIFAGVTQQALSKLEDTLTTRAPSESLKPFVGKDLTLTTNEGYTMNGKSVGNLKIYRSSYCAAVLRHYASLPEPNPTAVYSGFKFLEIGINSWIQDITGWKSYQDSRPLHTNVYIQRIEHMRDHKISDDLWVIFREASELLLLIEKNWQVPVNDYDLLDGSIGRRWSQHRKNQNWIATDQSYFHSYRDQRGRRECKAYELTELPYFRRWLRQVYFPYFLPRYLIDKYGKQAVILIYNENGLINDEVIKLTEIKRVTPAEEEKFRNFLAARSKLARY